jgi:hypothetical protein
MTRRLRQSVGEVFPRYGESASSQKPKPMPAVDPQMQTQATPERSHPLLAVVTANNLPTITANLEAQFKRQTSQLDPNNTTGSRTTLMLPVSVTEVSTLKTLVQAVDEEGIVVVIPANEVFTQSAIIQEVAQEQQS